MSSPQPLRICLLDDERIALLHLQTLLQNEENIIIQSASTSILETVRSIKEVQPDALFLDIQMPEASGFEVVEKIPSSVPVIFVTTSDAHAIRAFEVNALDYLVKPVLPERLRQSLLRLRSKTKTDPETPLLSRHDLVCLPMDAGRIFVPMEQLVSIESRSNYSRVYLADSRQFIVKRSLNEWEKKLDTKHFHRINRRWIIHLGRVEALENQGTKCVIRLNGIAAPLLASRRKGLSLKKLLQP